MVWNCVYGVVAAYLSDLCVPLLPWVPSQATGTLLVSRAQTATGQRSFAINGQATWNRLPPALVTGPVGERLQAGIEDEPVLDRPAPFKRLHDSGAGYIQTYLLTYLCSPQGKWMKCSTLGVRRSKIKVTGKRNGSNLWTWYSRNGWNDFAVNSHKWSTGQGHEMITFDGQAAKVKVTGSQSSIWRPGGGIILDDLGSSTFFRLLSY